MWILTCRSFASTEQQDNNPDTEGPPSEENTHTKMSHWPRIQTHYPYFLQRFARYQVFYYFMVVKGY